MSSIIVSQKKKGNLFVNKTHRHQCTFKKNEEYVRLFICSANAYESKQIMLYFRTHSV